MLSGFEVFEDDERFVIVMGLVHSVGVWINVSDPISLCLPSRRRVKVEALARVLQYALLTRASFIAT
ncbi:MAG: hypothetical protein R3C99_12680 [Pirellulaceae bacterium]